MFDLSHRLGAKLHVANNQNLTPLTLAAKLAKKEVHAPRDPSFMEGSCCSYAFLDVPPRPHD